MKVNRFIFDTNTLVSAFIFENSKPALALDKARESGKLFASDETFDELEDVLLRPKLDKYLSISKRLLILKTLRKVLIFLKATEPINASRDPKDNKFLELAITCEASCIISGDKDLLVLPPFRGISIMTASDFLINF